VYKHFVFVHPEISAGIVFLKLVKDVYNSRVLS